MPAFHNRKASKIARRLAKRKKYKESYQKLINCMPSNFRSPSITFPVIDLFAGPGGLGEGFEAYLSGRNYPFRVRLSIENDEHAYETLKLRSFFREFGRDVPGDYYEYLRDPAGESERLFQKHIREARAAGKKTWKATLGKEPLDTVDQRIVEALGGQKNWVLIGGPPCQAYSLVGRARMKRTHMDFENDPRHFLYTEYLRIISRHKPPVFVMENVKGILSSKFQGDYIFRKILRDLSSPPDALGQDNGLRYIIYSFVSKKEPERLNAEDFIIRSEEYGIPQSRHRVILLGVRSDINVRPRCLKKKKYQVPLWDVISDLPSIRSMISRGQDSTENWKALFDGINKRSWMMTGEIDAEVQNRIMEISNRIGENSREPGAEFMSARGIGNGIKRRNWFVDVKLKGVCNHSSRMHMPEDLYRYLFAACYASVKNESPRIKDFPKLLHPNHKNIVRALNERMFNDRFRVQIKNKPSSTITSHIGKDGHYYIHPDPIQCRSLTVREAARIQTFPDNYFFVGPRTAQYRQVGNAVPPLLALQLADVVFQLLSQMNAV